MMAQDMGFGVLEFVLKIDVQMKVKKYIFVVPLDIHSILVITNLKRLRHFIRYCRYSLLPFTIVAYILVHV